MRFKIEKIDSAILQWVDKNRFRHSGGEPFEWTEHGFLLRPMSDWSRNIAIKKSSQIGFSESFGVLKGIFGAARYKWNIIYTLPSDTFAEGFVTTKLNPILEMNPELKKSVSGGKSVKSIRTKDDNGKELVRFLHFRGTHNLNPQDRKAQGDKAISVTSDLNIHDERDRSDQHTIQQYESRLENSKYGGIWNFSNPAYPGQGTDDLYEKSDQKVWMIRCEHCSHYQWMEWVKLGDLTGILDHCLIDPQKKIFVCGKCGKEISDTARIHGEWVARYPSKDEISGYWMSQMNYVHHNAASMLIKEARVSKEIFCNFSLGLSYAGTDITVDRSAVVRNISPTTNNLRHVGMGVDNGIWKHYVIGDEEGIFKIGKTKSWDVIEGLRNKYKATMVVDGNPYPTTPKKLVKKYKGKVFMAFYKADKDAMAALDFKTRKDRGVVYIQRTKYFDILVEKFDNEEKPINILERDLEEYITQWEKMARQEVPDTQGNIRGVWVSSQKDDHYCHATVYQDIALGKSMGPRGEVGEETVEKTETNPQVDDKGQIPGVNIQEIARKASERGGTDWRY